MTIQTKKVDVVENYHGTDVADPYRWLEDPQDKEVQEWVDAQNKQTEDFLSDFPKRTYIYDRLKETHNFPKFSVPHKEGDYFYFQKNDGLQNQAVFYRTKDLQSEQYETVLDPNTMNPNGTAAITNMSFSKEGSKLAYGVSIDGSDWQEIKVMDLSSLKDDSDLIRFCKFSSIAWDEEGTGFYYNRFPDPETTAPEDQSYYNKVYFHKIGTSQDEDILIYEDPDNKEYSFSAEMSDDYKYLIISVWRGTENKSLIYYKEADSDGDFVKLIPDWTAQFGFLGNEGKTFYFKTNAGAPKEKVIAIDLDQPEKSSWKTIIPEAEDVLAFTKIINGQIVASYYHNAHEVLYLFDMEGNKQKEIPLPDFVSLTNITGKKEAKTMYIGYTSYIVPPSIVRYDFASGEVTGIFEKGQQFDADGFETTQVFYQSKDGTKVPMFLTHKKGLKLDGNNPVLLYGYGGFNISLTPSFSPGVRFWIEEGGVYAVANLRGGGEFGEEWYKAGTLERKQNVFDDFASAGEWLIENNYTTNKKLSIMGGSNGGLLVGTSITQRPDLFGAAICQVPVIDMLRYHKFTIGRYWVTDFGNAEDNADHFRFMYAYSPLHNVKEGTDYPPTLITTADTDDRVVPLHAKKFAAELQAKNGGTNPILLRVEKNAGHGLGKPITKILEEQTDVFSFLFKELQV